MEKKYPVSIKEVLNTLIKQQNLEEGLYKVRVIQLWNEVVGVKFKEFTRNVYVEDQVLIISLRSSIVRDSLQYQTEEIKNTINKMLDYPYVIRVEIR